MAHIGYVRPNREKQTRQLSFAKLEDRRCLIFNFRKACRAFAAQWYSAPKPPRPCAISCKLLLTGPHSVTPAEREMIATYGSSQNDCIYCHSCHGSSAAQHLDRSDADYELIARIKQNYEATEISSKMRALLEIAGKVWAGKQVKSEDIVRARQQGATDKEIHDTVLIATAFCMYNRYRDGLATWAPADADLYRENGRRLAEEGYVPFNRPAATVEKECW